jgi:tryptophan-rich sensory protein
MIRESERIHDALWRIAEESVSYADQMRGGGIFSQSVIAMINAHDQRLQVSLFNRISPIIWMTLFGMSMLSMAVMGYQAGLTGTRSTFATWTLAATFAFVIILITDLDRPRMSLFQMNQNLMVELHNRMDGGEPRDGSAATR